jgi:hypothetical protein
MAAILELDAAARRLAECVEKDPARLGASRSFVERARRSNCDHKAYTAARGGNPPQNGIKLFSTAEVTETAKDRAWLAKMTQTISQQLYCQRY